MRFCDCDSGFREGIEGREIFHCSCCGLESMSSFKYTYVDWIPEFFSGQCCLSLPALQEMAKVIDVCVMILSAAVEIHIVGAE